MTMLGREARGGSGCAEVRLSSARLGLGALPRLHCGHFLRDFFFGTTITTTYNHTQSPTDLRHSHKMASDEIVWQVINQQFCSFKLKYISLFFVSGHAQGRLLTAPTTGQPRGKTSAAMNTTLQACAIDNHAPWPTRATPPSAPTPQQAPFTCT